ncbi:Gfo/Idh/MocA family protein [Streptomyces profundus]|uniref:Gfo/Idh/MocA family protein n=1 Tax=Streptomyces profundus TaxID=2867410 RepID=UPI001D16AE9A|nr:Gfo/Idh/MocA family oxidoreductase [Streptomyces sp. MA3_2.13]UED87364.1 Gfo/Idh/MocA family oxidoreductase [Streptomyces sp. MA3_2.13]
MTSPRRIGVAGLGATARCYLAAVEELPQWDLVAVCDQGPPAGSLPRHVAHHTGHLAMLAGADLDALVVTGPAGTHAELCRDALLAGVPVCVEKPLALNPTQGRELAALAQARDLPLFTAFHRRYNDRVRALLRRLPVEVPVRSVVVRYLERIEEQVGDDTWQLDPAHRGGGCVADNGPHAFDLVRQLLGQVRVVDARVVRDGRGVDRLATVWLTAAMGAEARVELDWSHPGETKDVAVLLADGTEIHADMLADHPGFRASLRHEYRGLLTEFAEVVAAGRPAHRDGLSALELVADTYDLERAERFHHLDWRAAAS